MHRSNRRKLYLILILSLLTTSFLVAQGHGGPGGPGGPPGGGHGGPGGGGHGGGWGNHDSTGTGGPGGGGCDSTGHGGPGHGGHHGGGHGHWGHGDSTSYDSIDVSGVISTFIDTVRAGGRHGRRDSSMVERTGYLLDVDDDAVADYRIVRLRGLARHDSNFVFPVDGDQVDVSGFLVPSEENLDRIIVRDLMIGGSDLFGALLSTNPTMTNVQHSLQSRNYPNPFNPSTTIEFVLETAGHVSLNIYDITGARVASLVDERYNAGLHSIQFHPGTLSAGTYLYVLESGMQREVKRLAYLK
ncbi:MAG: T9SS type A sorting domain-containing protein [Candidatus Marinimicrobia bacterium]|nr:T9SS type A sorting domain-containing protein [FCB group bacterium]MBL7024662.1 T9SS type A sorting domain-containing protein [Candidatus Neomarinimicrobiota bacterium]